MAFAVTTMNARFPLRRFALALLAAGVFFTATLSSVSAAEARGGRVGWARLITPDARWGLHSNQDPKLADFIGTQTSLNIDPVWYSVAPDNLDQLCAYPFIYVKELVRISDPAHLRNIQEYVKRGGFICIDPCVNGFSPERKEDLVRRNAALFKQLFPESSVRELADDHEIYRCYFPVTVDELYTPDMIRRGAVKPAHIGLRGIFLGERMIAVISIAGLECGWPETPQRVPGCMKLIVNSYIYAMTR
jgi:hypothetical protein